MWQAMYSSSDGHLADEETEAQTLASLLGQGHT